jgi:hypothetical protein
MKYIANIHFGSYRIGDEVPYDLPNNDERLKRGLIREVKTINPTEKKVNYVTRKPKISSK